MARGRGKEPVEQDRKEMTARPRLFTYGRYNFAPEGFFRVSRDFPDNFRPSPFPIKRLLVTIRPPILFVSLALLVASGLSGCGRRGPLELPPETQAYGEALKKQRQEEAQTSGKPDPTPPFQPNSEQPSRKSDIPGTSGNRPPQTYPFPLDPIL
jgi:predicted small lipoprotein YifL